MTITIDHDFDSDRYVLMANCGRMSATPAGPRLFRAAPHPRIAFDHATQAEAEKDAATLRKYLDGLPARKQTKKEIREVGA